jgi:hypothetical protein
MHTPVGWRVSTFLYDANPSLKVWVMTTFQSPRQMGSSGWMIVKNQSPGGCFRGSIDVLDVVDSGSAMDEDGRVISKVSKRVATMRFVSSNPIQGDGVEDGGVWKMRPSVASQYEIASGWDFLLPVRGLEHVFGVGGLSSRL